MAPEVAGELDRIVSARAVRAVFQAAYGSGRVAELDWACRAAAFQAAAGLDPSLRLFVNCEPVSLGVACPDDLWPTVDAAERVPERVPKDLLLPMSRHIEDKGLDAAEPWVLLACFQEARHFSRPPGPGSGGWRPGRP